MYTLVEVLTLNTNSDPDVGDGVGQGVGPHKDSMLSSYLLQASDHRGLQAQNTKGEWIDCKSLTSSVACFPLTNCK